LADRRKAPTMPRSGRLFQEKGVIEEGGKKTSCQGAYPVHALGRPMRRGQGGPEGTGGIQSCTGEWTGDHDSQGDGQADAEAGDGAEGALFVDRGGEDDENEEERGDCLQDHGGKAREVAYQSGSSQRDGAPGFFGHERLQEKCGNDRAGQLSGPVENDVQGADPLGNPEADGDRRVEVAAGNVTKRRDHDGNRKTMGDSDTE